MRNKGQQGSISVFLSIILLIIIVLVGALVDGSRIYIAENQIKRAARIAARSALANYNTQLKEEYGLFAFDGKDTTSLLSDFTYFLKKNIDPMEELPEEGILASFINTDISDLNFLNLYDYSTIEDYSYTDDTDHSNADGYDKLVETLESNGIRIAPTDYSSLVVNRILKQQILETMKYRAPKELVEDFLAKLEILEKSGKTVELVKKKVEVEESLSEIGEGQKLLSDLITTINTFDKDGYKNEVKIISNFRKEGGESIKYFIEFNNVTDEIIEQETEIEELVEKIISKEIEIGNRIDDINDKNDDIYDVERDIESKKKEIDKIENKKQKSESDTQRINDLKFKISSLEKKKEGYKNVLAELESSLSKLQDEIEKSRSDLDRLKEEYEAKKETRDGYFTKINDAYTTMSIQLGTFLETNKNVKNTIKELIENSVTVQGEINDFEGDVKQSQDNDEIIQASGNQMGEDINSYNAKLKGEGLENNGFGDSDFENKYTDLNKLVKVEVETYYNELVNIIESVNGIDKETTGLMELAEKIGKPVAANYAILYKEVYKLGKLGEEIKKVNSSNEKFNLDLLTGYNSDRLLGYGASEDLIDYYSNGIKYVVFPEATKKIEDIKEDNKELEDDMLNSENYSQDATEQGLELEEEETTYLNDEKGDTEPGFWEKIWNFIAGKGDEDETTESEFSILPSRTISTDDKSGGSNNSSNNRESSAADKMINSFSLITDISGMLKNGANNFRDTVYINEYIMGTFKCEVPRKDGTNDFFNKYSRDSYFGNAEIEYILNGNSNEDTNINAVKIQVFTIRVAMNAVHIFANPSKLKTVTSIGTALSGGIPLLVPIVSTLIVFGWSSAESVVDMKKLMDGDSVPFYKITNREWKTDIGGIVETVAEEVVDESVKYIGDKVESIANNFLDMVFVTIENGIMELAIKAEGKTTQIADEVKERVGQFVDKYTESLPDELRDTIRKQLRDTIYIKVDKILKATCDAINDSHDKVKEVLEKEIKDAKKDVKSKINAIMEQIKDKADSFLKGSGNILDKSTSTDSFNLAFDYEDYLRILLLMRSEDTKLTRIMDLIQLNVRVDDKSFLLQDYYTLIDVDIVTSVNYMFMTKEFVPEKLRFKNGHKIVFSITKGY